MTALDSIEAESLACVRGGRLIFRNVGFCVRAGEILTVEGPNGSGKTSLLRLIAGFLRIEAGTLRFRSKFADLGDSEERGKEVGWLGHQDGLKLALTPKEVLGSFTHFYGIPVAAGEIDAVLVQVGLDRAAGIPCQYLSAGQRRRLALARLKLAARPLWLLDEPLAALDAQGRQLLSQLVAAHCSAGGIAIAATHESLGLSSIRLALP